MVEDANKILVVEDDKFIAHAYKDGLTRAGFEVNVASDGEKAMKKIKNSLPDLVLLDLMMPNKDGFEVLGDIKKDNKLKEVPVIILSNLGQDSDIEKSKQLGAVDYLVKSNISMKGIIEKVESYLTKFK